MKEYCRAGDGIQVVLSQRFRFDYEGDPFDLYRALRAVNPSPYMFFLRYPEQLVIGASPEVMVRVQGDEALVAPGHHAAILETGGDGTVRTEVADIARQIAWPRGFTARIRQNAFTDRWHGREEALRASASSVAPTYRQAFAAGDPENTGVWFGEAAGLIDRIEPAAQIVTRLCAEARALLTRPF